MQCLKCTLSGSISQTSVLVVRNAVRYWHVLFILRMCGLDVRVQFDRTLAGFSSVYV